MKFVSFLISAGLLVSGCVSPTTSGRVAEVTLPSVPEPQEGPLVGTFVLKDGTVVQQQAGEKELCFVREDDNEILIEASDIVTLTANRIMLREGSKCRLFPAGAQREKAKVSIELDSSTVRQNALLTSSLRIRTDAGERMIPVRNIQSYARLPREEPGKTTRPAEKKEMVAREPLNLPAGVSLVYSNERGVMLWQAGREPRLLYVCRDSINQVGSSPSDLHIAAELSPREIGDGFNQVRYSPDGRHIAAAVHPGKIIVLDVKTGHVQELTDGEMPDSAPTWSPDGSNIGFIRETHKDKSDLFITRVSSGKSARCTEDGEAYDPQWSPDGKWIIFSWRSQSRLHALASFVRILEDGKTVMDDSELAAYSCELEQVFMLTDNQTAEYGARWIPGTLDVVFVHWPKEKTGGWPNEQRISLMSVPGGNVRPICSLDLDLGMVTRISVSPDGKEIAIQTEEIQKTQDKLIIRSSVWSCPVSGGTPKRLYQSDRLINALLWLPESTQLLASPMNVPAHYEITEGGLRVGFSWDLAGAPGKCVLIDATTGTVIEGVADHVCSMDVTALSQPETR